MTRMERVAQGPARVTTSLVLALALQGCAAESPTHPGEPLRDPPPAPSLGAPVPVRLDPALVVRLLDTMEEPAARRRMATTVDVLFARSRAGDAVGTAQALAAATALARELQQSPDLPTGDRFSATVLGFLLDTAATQPGS